MELSRNRQIVEDFYSAIPARDVDKLAAVIEDGFAVEAVMRLPNSLPYGGVHSGRHTIKGLVTALLRTKTPMVLPESIRVVRVADAGDSIVVEAEFEWLAPGAAKPITMRAMEWLVFHDNHVIDIKISYWDTAACVEAGRQGGAG